MSDNDVRVFVRTTLELALLCFIAMALDRYRITLNVQHIDGFIFEVYQHLRYISDFVLDIEALHFLDRKSTRLNSSHLRLSRMPSSA